MTTYFFHRVRAFIASSRAARGIGRVYCCYNNNVTDDGISRRFRSSLALSVHFKQPELGMKDYEILSRATAFLLAVDPPTTSEPADTSKKSRYAHLDESRAKQQSERLKMKYLAEPAGGPPRNVTELGYLEFCPSRFRPVVHVLAASHVLAPWDWPNYYPQPWLQSVSQEHCSYTLEVIDDHDDSKGTDVNNNNEDGASALPKSLGKFPLNPHPIHYPEQKFDLAMIHLDQEDTTLKHLTDMGVKIWHLRDMTKPFVGPGDMVRFDGFHVSEDSVVHQDDIEQDESESKKEEEEDPTAKSNSSKVEEDTRIFVPYSVEGRLIAGSSDRIFAATDKPLPEGLCGGPTIDTDHGTICGIIEGIVPVDHEDTNMAGSAAFLPSPHIKLFVDYAERLMLEKILPQELFDKAVNLKEGDGSYTASSPPIDDEIPQELREAVSDHMDQQEQRQQQQQQQTFTAKKDEQEAEIIQDGTTTSNDADDEPSSSSSSHQYSRSTGDLDRDMGKEMEFIVESLKKSHSAEEVDAILNTIRREKDEVRARLERGEMDGDVDEIIKQVRAETLATREQLMATEEGKRIQKEIEEKRANRGSGSSSSGTAAS